MVGWSSRWEPGVGEAQQPLAVTHLHAHLHPHSRPFTTPSHAPRASPDPGLDGDSVGDPVDDTNKPVSVSTNTPVTPRPDTLPIQASPAPPIQASPAPPIQASPAPHTNGTRKRVPHAHAHVYPHPHTFPKSFTAEEGDTAPLTGTNGEANHPRLNGVVVKKMAVPTEDAVIREEGGGEEEEEEVVLEELEEEELKCGLGRCAPAGIQKCANKKMFLFVFCLTSVLQGMYNTYVVSILTTIEKLFQLQSKTTGIILSATEMGQIGGALLLTYYGGHGHRPKWIGWGIVFFSFFAFFSSLPHFLFGDSILEDMQDSMVSQLNSVDTANTCKAPGWGLGDTQATNATGEEVCEPPDSKSHVVMSILFVSLLGVGIGQTAAYNLGIPYIDDNIATRESPIYFAVTSGVRILGPTMGFMLGYFCTKLYVDPSVDPGFTTKDPRWIGAWWLGLVVVSVALLFTSLAMFSFPRALPARPSCSSPAHRPPAPLPRPNPSLRDFPKAVRRLLGNEILMLRMASSVLHILPISGLYTFLPKYLENQFRLPVHNAALVSGLGGILVMGVGIFTSGVFIRRAKPSARAVSAWIAVTALIYAVGMGVLMFVGCPAEDFVGLVDGPGGKQFVDACNNSCGSCDTNKFAPICDNRNRTYFSACRAGCYNVTHVKDELVYSNCECLEEGDTAVLRLCDLECNNFTWYVVIFSIFVLVHSTSEVGGMLVTLRCVDPRDKAMALGLISGAIGLFGNVPCPIIYGAVVDYACIHWQETCGEPGACQFYDADIFRMFFHGVTGSVMLLAFLVDTVVWYKAKSVSFTDMDDNFDDAASMSHRSMSRSPSTAMMTVHSPSIQSPTSPLPPDLAPLNPSQPTEDTPLSQEQSMSSV